jgi:hypothetical protein
MLEPDHGLKLLERSSLITRHWRRMQLKVDTICQEQSKRLERVSEMERAAQECLMRLQLRVFWEWKSGSLGPCSGTNFPDDQRVMRNRYAFG